MQWSRRQTDRQSAAAVIHNGMVSDAAASLKGSGMTDFEKELHALIEKHTNDPLVVIGALTLALWVFELKIKCAMVSMNATKAKCKGTTK